MKDVVRVARCISAMYCACGVRDARVYMSDTRVVSIKMRAVPRMELRVVTRR